MGLKIHNGLSLVDYTGFKIYNGTAWVTPNAGKIYDGVTWKDFLIVFATINDTVVHNETNEGGIEALATWQMGAIGTGRVNFTNGVSYDWVTPTSAGGNYYIRATVSSGATPTGSAVNSWISTGSAITWEVRVIDPDTTVTSNLSISIATDSGGTNIVHTGSVSLTASKGF